MSKTIKTTILGLAGATMLATAASAGGFSRGTADTDILFEEGNFNMRAGVTVVSPTRKYTASEAALGGLVPANANVGTDYADTYAIPSAAIKFNLTDQARCAGTITQPYGGSASTAIPTGGSGKVKETFTVTEFGATCAYFVPLAKGRAAIIGGVFTEAFAYDLAALGGALNVDLSASAVGYRIGAAYEIPEIALRAQLMYRSQQNHSATGNTTRVGLTGTALDAGLPLGVSLPIATGSGVTPQMVDLKVQSGIAPGWLAFGSIRWTDWSVFKTLNLNTGATPPTTNDYYYKDGWTFTLGVGHAFNDNISGAVFASYDTNVGTGFDLASRTITLGSAVSAKGGFGEVTVGGAVSFLGAASDINGNAVGNGIALAGTANYKVKF